MTVSDKIGRLVWVGGRPAFWKSCRWPEIQ